MKTRIQWINSLPEAIRQRAISRIQEQLICPDWKEEFCCLELCLRSCFSFKKTTEGEMFWIDIIIIFGDKPLIIPFTWWQDQHVKLLKKMGR